MSDTATAEQVTLTPSVPPAPAPNRDGDAIDRAMAGQINDDAWLTKFDPPSAVDAAPAPEAVAAPTTKTEQPAADAPQETSPDAAGGDETKAEYETALRALRRDGIPKSALEKLEPTEVISWGAQRAKNHADIDQAYADLKSLKAKASEPAKTETKPTQSPVAVDLKALVKPVAEKLGLDEADAPALEAFAKTLLDAASQENASVRQTNERLQAGLVEITVDRAREKLSGRFPGLQDDAKFETVVQKALTIDPSLSIHERIADAAAIVFFDEIKQASSAATRKSVEQKLSGQPSTTSRPTPPKALSSSEQDDWFLNKIENERVPWKEAARQLSG